MASRQLRCGAASEPELVHNQIITYKRDARDKPYDRPATSQRERCQSLYDRFNQPRKLDFLHLFSGRDEKMRCIFYESEL